jgi:hydroxyacylglutathione hydrolase
MAGLMVETLEVGSLATCAYLAWREGEEACALVDPGGDAAAIRKAVSTRGLSPEAILVTHSHFDHVAALAEIKDAFPDAEILAHPLCSKRMVSPEANLGFMVGMTVKCPSADRTLEDGGTVEVGTTRYRALHCPGHAPGHLVFYSEADEALFSGDVLFQGSLGRTDFEGCSFADLAASLRERILTLPGETRVYPGHGPATTIAEERGHNPFVRDILAGQTR